MSVWQRSGYTLSPLNSSVHIPNWLVRRIQEYTRYCDNENEIYAYNEV